MARRSRGVITAVLVGSAEKLGGVLAGMFRFMPAWVVVLGVLIVAIAKPALALIKWYLLACVVVSVITIVYRTLFKRDLS